MTTTPTVHDHVDYIRSLIDEANEANANGKPTQIGRILVALQQVCDVLDKLADEADANDRTARRANDVAGMLANGIQPD